MDGKVAIVGMGNVGSTIAYTLLLKDVCGNLVLTDKNRELLHAQMLDLQHASVLMNRNIIIEEKKYLEFKDIDLVIFTAAAPLIHGQTRLDMLETSRNIVIDIIPQIMNSGFNGIILVVTNPVDIVSYLVYKYSGLPNEQVIGTGTFLDILRLKQELSKKFHADVSDISTYILGEHGDSQVIIWSNTTIKGQYIEKIARDYGVKEIKKIEEEIEEKVKRVGWDIANYKRATTYGIATVVAEIVESIFDNTYKEIVVSTLNDNIYSSIPIILGKTGVKRKLKLRYSNCESEKIIKSKNILKKFSLLE